MWGIIPAAGQGSRIQPLAFSKELLPVGSQRADGKERPRAVSEYLVERMILAGAKKICVVLSPEKADIFQYFGANVGPATLVYVIQPEPLGLCDAIFRALPLIPPEEPVLVGLPDTIWFPEDGFLRLSPHDALSFLCFPVGSPEHFDAVVSNPEGLVEEIQVKSVDARSHWIWGAFSAKGATLSTLYDLWRERGAREPYLGTLINAWIARGGSARAVRAGHRYIDVGTVDGYRNAIRMLAGGEERREDSCKGI